MGVLDSLKQLKQLREQAGAMRSALAQEHVVGKGADGKVAITMDGNQEILSVSVDPSLLTPDARETIERGIREAFTSAQGDLRGIMARKLREGGLAIPGA